MSGQHQPDTSERHGQRRGSTAALASEHKCASVCDDAPNFSMGTGPAAWYLGLKRAALRHGAVHLHQAGRPWKHSSLLVIPVVVFPQAF